MAGPGPDRRPLPSTKFLSHEPVEGFSIAHLDWLSQWNRLAAFNHPQSTIEVDALPYVFAVLDFYFPLLSLHSQTLSLEEAREIALNKDHRDKACGYPASFYGCSRKWEAISKLGVIQLMDYYSNNTSVIGSTLKDEIRAITKDARLFRPQDVSSYLEGTCLFTRQNEYLMSKPFSSPLFVKFVTPGPDILRLYKMFEEFGGRCYSVDGVGWDAAFQLFLAQIICSWRCRGFSAKDQERIVRYYSMMYNGYTEADGLLYHLVGQPSGHVNTTIDNCLGHVIMMAYHAYREGLSLLQFYQQVMFSTCGDDMLYSDLSGRFEPEMLSRHYAEHFMGLEYESLDPGLGTFVGSIPCQREFDGVVYHGYSNRVGRAIASSKFEKRGRTPIDRLSKLVSLTMKVFFNEQAYNLLYSATMSYAVDQIKALNLSADDPRVCGLLAVIEPRRLLRMYMGWESKDDVDLFFLVNDLLKLNRRP